MLLPLWRCSVRQYSIQLDLFEIESGNRAPRIIAALDEATLAELNKLIL